MSPGLGAIAVIESESILWRMFRHGRSIRRDIRTHRRDICDYRLIYERRYVARPNNGEVLILLGLRLRLKPIALRKLEQHDGQPSVQLDFLYHCGAGPLFRVR